MSIQDELREYQLQSLKKRQAEFEERQKEADDYNNSEQAERDAHEHYQDLWEAKARREGWQFKREPFISAADRQKMAEEEKAEKIAYLEEQLKALKES